MSPRHLRGVLVAALLAGCASPPPTAPPVTLRALYGARPPAALAPAKTALVLVDFQEEFFRGPLPVVGAADAVDRAASLLAWARRSGIVVAHVRNVSSRPGSRLFDASSPNVAIVPALAPLPEELVVTKSMAGAFSRTDLDARLRSQGIETVIVAGIMTHLAVDTSARDAMVLGYRVIVAADACATRALPSPIGGPQIDARDVHRTALASLADRFADVLDARAIASLPLER